MVAFERRDGAFGLGIVGRLDWGLDQVYGTILFEAFLHACQSFDRARQQHHGWNAVRDTLCGKVADLVKHQQPLITVPHASRPEKRSSFSVSDTPPVSNSAPGFAGPQERLRQRSSHPTKEALNRMRRQRLKVGMR
ncbi:hypothetical protein KDA_49590 [Dictyobacter alpinus]|uniref:Uncharacterized protein n=1 Tax=Dictyobacter alpinus TaxID=2014873 RepID=A0A402BDP7_9CHLR|nr:hypothetical protein [Dictyobacter alpinus]GCE29475.1 hypothetical protein KDA_49590 [Dictyobacter alpinus]